ncbi:hypothetical protein [Streptomyces albogriseolus]|uniref:hypothetical protein n=1 Tax=Streptomyces albogriseolus TaxID=1887 RepID=UPI00345FF6F5
MSSEQQAPGSTWPKVPDVKVVETDGPPVRTAAHHLDRDVAEMVAADLEESGPNISVTLTVVPLGIERRGDPKPLVWQATVPEGGTVRHTLAGLVQRAAGDLDELPALYAGGQDNTEKGEGK